MMDENDIIKQKLIERSADLDVARQRWIFAFVASVLLFSVVLVLFILPVSETSSEQNVRFSVRKDSYSLSEELSVVAIPSTYWINFDFEMDRTAATDHNRAYVYLYKDNAPDISVDSSGSDPEQLRQFFRSTSFRNGSITYSRPTLEWSLAFRDSDTTSYYVVIYNPDNPDDLYDGLDTDVLLSVNYEPMLPLVPIFFILSFIILLPLMIIRVYVINQKKKEMRVLLSLDLDNLSNEDKVRLGIPISAQPHDEMGG